jgi:hypothetical protein
VQRTDYFRDLTLRAPPFTVIPLQGSMRITHTLFASLLVAGLAGGGYLYAQPGGGDEDLPEVTAPGQVDATLSPREMANEATRLIAEMEAYHVRVLELQGAARKAKDVIKLNCVNESLLAVKQLLNIADSAQTDPTEAIAGGDRAQQLHDYGQVKLAHERSTAERDNAENCIGDELIFVGKPTVDTVGPAMPDDPTDDNDDGFITTGDPFFRGGTVGLERPAYASPFH